MISESARGDDAIGSKIKELPSHCKHGIFKLKPGVFIGDFWISLRNFLITLGVLIININDTKCKLHGSFADDTTVEVKAQVYKKTNSGLTGLTEFVIEFRNFVYGGCTIVFNRIINDIMGEFTESIVSNRMPILRPFSMLPLPEEMQDNKCTESQFSESQFDEIMLLLISPKYDRNFDGLTRILHSLKYLKGVPKDSILMMVLPFLENAWVPVLARAMQVYGYLLTVESADVLLHKMREVNANPRLVEVARQTSSAIRKYSEKFHGVMDRTAIAALADARPYNDEVTRNLRAAVI